VAIGQHGRHAGYTGLVTCKSVWSCPVCARGILRARREEIKTAVRWARDQGYRVAMVTLTVRHGFGDNVHALVHGIAAAWRAIWQGKAAVRRMDRWRLVGMVRRIEATYGAHGWHPHVHVIVVSKRKLRERHQRELARAWEREIGDRIGAEHVPSRERGVLISGVDAEGRYLSKMALEISAHDTKEPRHGGRSPWAVAASDAPADRAAWRAWIDGTRGVRLLTWTRGDRDLRELAGIVETSDQDAAAEVPADAAPVARIPVDAWRVVRAQRGAAVALLDAAEADGAPGVQRALAIVLAKAGWTEPVPDVAPAPS
jgi:hypothetical protein